MSLALRPGTLLAGRNRPTEGIPAHRGWAAACPRRMHLAPATGHRPGRHPGGGPGPSRGRSGTRSSGPLP